LGHHVHYRLSPLRLLHYHDLSGSCTLLGRLVHHHNWVHRLREAILLGLVHGNGLVTVVDNFSIVRSVIDFVFKYSLDLIVGTREGSLVFHVLFHGRRTVHAFFTMSRVLVGHALAAVRRVGSLSNAQVAVGFTTGGHSFEFPLLALSDRPPLFSGLLVSLPKLFLTTRSAPN